MCALHACDAVHPHPSLSCREAAKGLALRSVAVPSRGFSGREQGLPFLQLWVQESGQGGRAGAAPEEGAQSCHPVPCTGPCQQPSLCALDLCEGVPAGGPAVHCGVAELQSGGPRGRIESPEQEKTSSRVINTPAPCDL